MFLSYKDVSRLLADQRLRNYGLDILALQGVTEGRMFELFGKLMFNNEGEVHRRLRSLVAKAFTPRSVEVLRPAIFDFISERIANMVARGNGEIVGELAKPLSISALCQILGVPSVDIPTFEKWTADLGLAFGFMSPEEVENAHVAADGLMRYVDELVITRRATPADDLVTALIRAEEEGDRLSQQELCAMVANMLFGGYDTTYRQASLAVMNLIQNSKFLAEVAANSDQLGAVVDELIRYDPTVAFAARVALEPVELGHTTIGEGELVMLSIIAANRDPQVFQEPDTLRLGRSGAPRQLGFGHGIHHCLGSALARVQLEEVVRVVVEQLKGWRLALPLEEIDWYPPTAAFRGPITVPITATPTSN
jgi:cytochrome P450